METATKPAIKIPHCRVGEEDFGNIRKLNPSEKQERKNLLLRSVGIEPTQNGAYLDYINMLQRLNGFGVCPDLQPELYEAISSDKWANNFLMMIAA